MRGLSLDNHFLSTQLKNKTILVTGASGKTGKAVMDAFLKADFSVKALVHSPQHAYSYNHKVTAICGELLSRKDLIKAMEGCSAIYHICPNMHPDEIRIGRLVIQIAQANKIEHFVYHSVLHPHIKEMPHHWKKMQVEGLLFKSGLNFTILQPAAYMQNLLQYKAAIQEKGIYAVPYNGKTRVGMVDLRDIAEAAASVIKDDTHFGSTYELAADNQYNQQELCELASRICKRNIIFNEIPRDQWVRQMEKSGMPAYAIGSLNRMFAYYETYGFTGNGKVLQSLLGRKPNSLTSFIREFF